MKVPFRLARLERAAAADAGLLFAADAAALAKVCATIQPVPTVFRVAGGFLLLAPVLPPGVLRLRRLGGELFVPVDAQLLPRLLPDEVVGLTRDRGWIVLADGALAFDPARPLRPHEWLKPPPIRRGAWTALPDAPDRAERLTVVERPTPPDVAIEVLTGGRPDGAAPLSGVGEVPDDARPGAGSMIGRAGAGLMLGAAQFVTWAGKQLNAPGLAKLGGGLARRALENVPRLSEKVLGAQEAALREVLRQLQAGDIEKALKRAPVAVGDPNRKSSIGTNANLQSRDPRFSLRDLLGGGGGGAAWLGGGDVWQQLAIEYRRLAEEAAKRGDARRAAYLYGVLLRDLRSAANALVAGGYFRDAAILYRDKLSDSLAAAHAFERAGDYDEAVRLYERREDYEAAAELLRRIGDEERATDFFERAAAKFQNQAHWVKAGDLLRQKLGRQQPATDCYREGWTRGGSGHLTCGTRLIDDYLAAEAWGTFDELLTEAAAKYPPPDASVPSQFFNYALSLEEFLPPERRAAVRDRVQQVFARHLRHDAISIRQGSEKVRELFVPKGGWTGPQVRDAEYATRAWAKQMKAAPIVPTLPPAAGQLSAVVVAKTSRDLVLGIGNIVSVWRCATGETVRVTQFANHHVIGLSTNDDASVLHVLFTDGVELHLRCYAADGDAKQRLPKFAPQGQIHLENAHNDAADWYLQPQSGVQDGEPCVRLARTGGQVIYQGLYLNAKSLFKLSPVATGPRVFLVASRGPGESWEWDENFCRHIVGTQTRRWVPSWEPAKRTVDWVTNGPDTLQVVGINSAGHLFWTEFDGRNPDNPTMTSAYLPDPKFAFDAACLRGANHIAAAVGREIVWLSAVGGKLVPYSRPTPLGIPSRVVFLATGRTLSEVLTVFADGTVVRVPLP